MEFIEKYNYFIKGSYKGECAKSIARINKLKKKNNEYIKNIEKLYEKINEEKNIIDRLSQIEDSYKKILRMIKNYLNGNKDDNIKCCPICLNKDFTETFKQLNIQYSNGQSIKNQLIKIIDTTVQSGNIDIEKRQNVIINKNQEMRNLKNIYNKKIYKSIEYYIDESKLYYEKITELASEKVSKSLTRKEKHKKYL